MDVVEKFLHTRFVRDYMETPSENPGYAPVYICVCVCVCVCAQTIANEYKVTEFLF